MLARLKEFNHLHILVATQSAQGVTTIYTHTLYDRYTLEECQLDPVYTLGLLHNLRRCVDTSQLYMQFSTAYIQSGITQDSAKSAYRAVERHWRRVTSRWFWHRRITSKDIATSQRLERNYHSQLAALHTTLDVCAHIERLAKEHGCIV